MKLRTWLLLPLITLLTACAPTMQPKELSIPPQRSIHTGFSILPPNERGWLVLTQEPIGLILGKRGNDPDESITFTARAVYLPEFKSREEFIGIAKALTLDTESTHFNEISQEPNTIVIDGQSCESFKLLTKDKGMVRITNRTDPMILEEYSLVCPHPQKNLAIIVSYSHRCYPGQADPEMAKKAEEIFRTVEFKN